MQIAKKIPRHVHSGITFLHSHRAMHRDINKDDIFFLAPSLDSYIAEELVDKANPVICPGWKA